MPRKIKTAYNVGTHLHSIEEYLHVFTFQYFVLGKELRLGSADRYRSFLTHFFITVWQPIGTNARQDHRRRLYRRKCPGAACTELLYQLRLVPKQKCPPTLAQRTRDANVETSQPAVIISDYFKPDNTYVFSYSQACGGRRLDVRQSWSGPGSRSSGIQ